MAKRPSKPRRKPPAGKKAARMTPEKNTSETNSKRTPKPKTWPFDQSPDSAAITLRRIVLPKKGQTARPVLYVSHDTDGTWQFLDGGKVKPSDAAVVALDTMLAHDPTLGQIADLPPGWVAERTRHGSDWSCAPAE